MPKTQKLIQSLNAGELSPLMDFRIDQQKYVAGCRMLENFYPLIYGGVERRPGSRYIGEVKSSEYYTKIVGFEYNVETTYLLEMGNQYIRFWENDALITAAKASVSSWTTGTAYIIGDFKKAGTPSVYYRCIVNHTSTTGGAHPTPPGNTTDWIVASETAAGLLIYEIISPYLTVDLFELKFEHSNDVKWITHPDYEERRLSRISHSDSGLTVAFILDVESLEDGPFLDQNTDISSTITPAEIDGGGIAAGASITLTAHLPIFTTGTTAGHAPSGTTPTSKSLTGTLFRIVHALASPSIQKNFTAVSQTSDSLLVYEDVHWDFVTGGTWTGKVTLQRSYDNVVWETVFETSSQNNANARTDMVEEGGDAYYRIISSLGPYGAWSGTCNCQLSVRDQEHIGVVKITAVASTKIATATVLTTLGSTNATHRWSEGYFSNKNGWPRTVCISAEERLTYAGNKNYPLTIWGSTIGNYVKFKEGTADNDPITFTLIGQGQQNAIRWIKAKDVLIIGTAGGEHVIGSSTKDKPLTPTNVRAKIQSTYGSADVDSLIVNDAILFIQRGGRKLREFRYSFEADAYIADDLTIFAGHITENKPTIALTNYGTGDVGLTYSAGIVSMAYQRTPEPFVWCVRNDGKIVVLAYEKSQNVFAWSKILTADTVAGAGRYEDVVVKSTSKPTPYIEGESAIYSLSSSAEEDYVYVLVNRTIGDATKRYIERFNVRNFYIEAASQISNIENATIDNTILNAFFVDSGITFYSSGATTIITGLNHLEGETVDVWGSNEITVELPA